MPFPEDSSHFQHWIFTEEQLNQLRLNVLKEGETNTRQKLPEAHNIQALTKLFPTYDELTHLISYFVTQLIFVCSEKRLDYRITNTAAAFLTRFYLKRNVIEHDPRRVLLTCLLLAIKTEECSTTTSLRHFCDGLISSRQGLADVIDCELIVLDALSFEIRVLHARPPIHFLTTEYYQCYKPTDPNKIESFSKLVSDINRQVELLALQAYTDPNITFLFSPAQIAVAAFLQVSEGILPKSEEFISALIAKRKDFSFRFGDALRPLIQDVRTRLVLMTDRPNNETDESRAQKALRTIKKIEKITKIVQKANIANSILKNNNQISTLSEVKYSATTENVQDNKTVYIEKSQYIHTITEIGSNEVAVEKYSTFTTPDSVIDNGLKDDASMNSDISYVAQEPLFKKLRLDEMKSN